ncbi:MAG TPA: serine/threonine-protein kinase, partial [Candidatus Udaeobacter sp.]|nr:serine/threonine-protein kinase [Candidatus Udaeobacter sp.]
VYRARDPHLDLDVALKLLDDHHTDTPCETEVIAEARNLARVRHPNVALVYGAERRDGRVGVWMELVRGQNLEDVLRERGPLGASEVANYGRDLCRALAAVHNAGVLHRDVKTENVMREDGGRIVLVDFGICREAQTTSAGGMAEALGTPLYMAPELFQGATESAQSDIYSLGVVLFRMLTGRYPVEGRTCLDVRCAHEEGRRLLLEDLRPGLSENLIRVVEKALEPDPKRRYRSAGELERALKESVEGVRRPRWPVVLAAASAGLIVAYLYFNPPSGRGEYVVDAMLYRTNPGQREPLLPGATIAIGDRFQLEFKGSKPLNVYVISKDENGEVYLLFPMNRSELRNPLSAGVKHHLPGTDGGAQINWQATSAGGRERLLIVASRRPIADFEAQMQLLSQPSANGSGDTQVASGAGGGAAYAPVPDQALAALRGLGGTVLDEPEAENPAEDIFDQAAKLAAREESVNGAWVRQIDLVYT